MQPKSASFPAKSTPKNQKRPVAFLHTGRFGLYCFLRWAKLGGRSFHLPGISEADYIELVDFTGRELHPGKRGKIAASEPKALTKLGLDKNHWVRRVKGAVIRTIN